MAKPVGAKDKIKGNKRGLHPTKRPLMETRVANQWHNTPQQKLFMENWLNPKSPTFGNQLQSALNAGYSPRYANQIASESTGNKWLSVFTNRDKLEIEHILNRLQDMVTNEVDSRSKDDTRLKAIELYAKLSGYLTDKKEVTHTVKVELGRANTIINQD